MLDTNHPCAPEMLLDNLFAVTPSMDRTITVYRSGSKTTLSHAALMDQVLRVAVQLDALGLQAGNRIGICAANRIEWLLLDMAALRLGLVVAGFKPGDFTADQTLIDTYGLTVLFADTQAAGVTPFEVLSPASGPTGPLPPRPVRQATDAAALKFTSGSTGAAKGLAASYGSIGMSISAVQDMFAHGRDDRLFVFLTLSLLQQRYWVYSALLFGCDLVISTAQLALHAMRDSAPTVIMGVPAFFETLKEMIDASGATPEAAQAVTGGRVRYMWTGSAPIREDLLRCFDDEFGLPLFEGYGMNESCIVTKNHFSAHRRGSAGQPVNGKQVWIGEDGIIRVRSALPVAREYAFAPEGASSRIFEADGVIITGDLGEIDADGYLWVKGRADDVIVLENATNILARPIEERLMAIDGVRQVIVCGSGKPHLSAIVDITAGFDPARVLEAVRSVPPATPNEAIRTAIAARTPFTEESGLLTSQGKPRRMSIEALHALDLETLQKETL